MVNKLTGLEGGLEVGQKINEIIDAKADVNADTTGNAGTATKLANARTITLSGDVSGSFSFDGSGNKTVTTSLNNTTKIDGQWVSKTETLSTATAVGTYTIDLSSYLPNDNYNYEVLIKSDVSSGAVDSYTSARGVEIFGGDIIEDSILIGRVQKFGVYNVNTFRYPVKSRTINITVFGGKLSGHKMTAYAYRRIGTNA